MISLNLLSVRVLIGVRKLTTPAPQLSILNPNKISPTGAKFLKPIVPVTHPRFTDKDQLPSVTKVLSATMPAASRYVLDRWKEGMIKKLGVSGFYQYQKDTFARGHALHSLLADYLMGKGGPDPENSNVSNLWNSIKTVVFEKISNVRLIEHTVTHKEMKYRGIIDCVACFEDELVVIDFKTAEKAKKDVESLYDNPLQISAYCGALNNDLSIPKHVIDRNISSGVVIVAYTDGSEASTYYLSNDDITNKYWTQWTQRLDQFVRMEDVKIAS